MAVKKSLRKADREKSSSVQIKISIIGGIVAIIAALIGIVPRFMDKQPTTQVSTPHLLYPKQYSTIAQPHLPPGWAFGWEEPRDPTNVRQYHLIVQHEGSPNPMIDIMTDKARFRKPPDCSYIPARSAKNWKWKVRTQNLDGKWGPWTLEYTFHVDPLSAELWCSSCPELCTGKAGEGQ